MKKVLIIFITIFILFLLLFSVIFSIININNNKILIGVKVDNIDISNMTIDEAKEKINNWNKENNEKNLILNYKDFEDSINISSIIVSKDVETAVEEAYKVGRQGNIIQNNYTILNAMLGGKNINTIIEFNEEEIDKKINEINSKLPGVVVKNSYYIEDNNLIIKKGKNGIQIKKDELKEKIKNTVIKENKEINIPTENALPGEIDIEKIHSETYKKEQNAYVSKNPTKVNPEVNGIDFAISLEEAKQLLKEEKEEYIIPLKITMPKITINNLGEDAFPDKLGEFTTRYDASNKNRSTNLELASAKIDGTVIMPGETFSYNKIVGERTISAGYKEAPVYAGGKVVDGIGGGICQLSSTLYNAVVYANLEVTNRSNHRFTTSYVEIGRDATVSWGTIDFCFKNTREYPIKVVSKVEGGVAKVSICGIKEEKEYDITIQSTVTEKIPYTVSYIDDETLNEGQEVVQQSGAEGAKSITYKIVKYNGMVISKTVLSTDSYSAMERIIKRGTKKIEPVSGNVEEVSEEI